MVKQNEFLIFDNFIINHHFCYNMWHLTKFHFIPFFFNFKMGMMLAQFKNDLTIFYPPRSKHLNIFFLILASLQKMNSLDNHLFLLRMTRDYYRIKIICFSLIKKQILPFSNKTSGKKICDFIPLISIVLYIIFKYSLLV